MKGAPRDLLPGDPICAPMRTVLAEASVVLLRSLSEYPLWKDEIASAILKGLQQIRSVSLLSPDQDKKQTDSSQSGQQGFAEDNHEGSMQVRTGVFLFRNFQLLEVAFRNFIGESLLKSLFAFSLISIEIYAEEASC